MNNFVCSYYNAEFCNLAAPPEKIPSVLVEWMFLFELKFAASNLGVLDKFIRVGAPIINPIVDAEAMRRRDSDGPPRKFISILLWDKLKDFHLFLLWPPHRVNFLCSTRFGSIESAPSRRTLSSS